MKRPFKWKWLHGRNEWFAIKGADEYAVSFNRTLNGWEAFSFCVGDYGWRMLHVDTIRDERDARKLCERHSKQKW